MKHVTRWSPDTCTCVLEYEWDDTDPSETRQHNLKTYVSKCAAHTSLATDSDRYTSVKDENSKKNITLGDILTNGPSSLFDEAADGSRTLKGNITYNWSWSGTAPNRVLTVSFTGITLTQQQKNNLQTFINNKFGAGKIILA
jgi:hypothetical protein